MKRAQVIITLACVSFVLKSSKCDGDVTFTYTNIVESHFVGEKCRAALQEYDRALRDGTYWALKMSDATAKLQSGIFSGNLEDLGAFEQCIKISTNTSVGIVNGKYCVGKFTLPLTFTYQDQRTFKNKKMSWSVCVPNACDGTEVSSIYSTILSGYLKVDVDLTIDEDLCQDENVVNAGLELGAKITIISFLVLLCFVVCSTIYDVYVFYQKSNPCHQVLVAFSVLTNGRALLKTTKNSDHLHCFDGLRFISIIWIVLLHEYSVFPTGPVLNIDDVDIWKNSLYSMYVNGGNVAVDTFFVLSGFLVTYTFLKKEDTTIDLCKYYLHRYLRLTPALAAAVLVSATLLQYSGSGPYWQYFVKYFQKPCEDHWWTTLLYIQNYTNVTRMCVGHAWYLAVDMQLFLVSPLILFILRKSTKWAYVIVSILILASIASAFVTAWNLKLAAITANSFGNRFLYMNNYYLLTHTRASSWLIGLLFGAVLVHLRKNAYKIDKPIAVALWIMSLSVLALCIFGGHQTLRDEDYDRWGNALHIALVKPSWCLAICWIIFACVFGYGGPINAFLSISPFQVLSKLTYSMYIIHVTLLYMKAYARKYPTQFSDLAMVYNFWGDCCFTVLIASVWVLMFEAPVSAIEKLLWNKKEIKKSSDCPITCPIAN